MARHPRRACGFHRQRIAGSSLPARAITRPYSGQCLLEELENQMNQFESPHVVSYKLVLTALALFAFTTPCPAAEPTPLIHTHAHNDYEHKRPLFDALEHGFCSVEADIYLVDGQLLVAHNRSQVKPERTLQALYLDPLRELVKKNGGRVYPGGPE